MWMSSTLPNREFEPSSDLDLACCAFADLFPSHLSSLLTESVIASALFIMSQRGTKREAPDSEENTSSAVHFLLSTDPPAVLATDPPPVEPLPEQFMKRARHYSCDLNTLADVELQLILQWLSNKEKLKAARVSRRLLTAASHPFSWRGAAPFVLSSKKPEYFGLVTLSLARFAPFQLTWESPLTTDQMCTLPSLQFIHQPAHFSCSV
jgi:hypothetical protein